MREIRLYGSEGGEAQTNGLSLPLSFSTLRVVRPPKNTDAERPRRHSHGGPWERVWFLALCRSVEKNQDPIHG